MTAMETGCSCSRFPTRSAKEKNDVRRGFIEQPEYERMCNEADCEGLWLRALLEVAYTYGWRKGELVDITVDRVS